MAKYEDFSWGKVADTEAIDKGARPDKYIIAPEGWEENEETPHATETVVQKEVKASKTKAVTENEKKQPTKLEKPAQKKEPQKKPKKNEEKIEKEKNIAPETVKETPEVIEDTNDDIDIDEPEDERTEDDDINVDDEKEIETTEVEEEEEGKEEDYQKEEDEEPQHTGHHVSIEIKPSQDEMLNHLSQSEKLKKQGIIFIVVAVLMFLGSAAGTITMIGFLLSAILVGLYGYNKLKLSKEEDSFVSDTKNGYLQLENGVLHCEQGVGTQYEEIHIKIKDIEQTLAYGRPSERTLVLGFETQNANMLVNNIKVEEDIFELRGGMFTESDWRKFAKAFDRELPSDAKFDVEAWDEEPKSIYKVLMIIGFVLFGLSILLRVLIGFGYIAFVFV